MKKLVTSLFLITFLVGPAHASCASQQNQMKAQIQQISNRASSMGICQAARALADVYQRAATLLRGCPSLDPSGNDAGAYQQGAQQARQTASASCQ